MFLTVNYESLLVHHQVLQEVDAIYGHNVCPSMIESRKVGAHSYSVLSTMPKTCVKNNRSTWGIGEHCAFQSSAHLFLNSTSYLSKAGPRACCLKIKIFIKIFYMKIEPINQKSLLNLIIVHSGGIMGRQRSQIS